MAVAESIITTNESRVPETLELGFNYFDLVNKEIVDVVPESDVKGVSWSTEKKKWRVEFQEEDDRLFLGYFGDKKKAEARARAFERERVRRKRYRELCPPAGIAWHKRDQVWQVSKAHKNGRVYIGSFKYLIDAEKALEVASTDWDKLLREKLERREKRNSRKG